MGLGNRMGRGLGRGGLCGSVWVSENVNDVCKDTVPEVAGRLTKSLGVTKEMPSVNHTTAETQHTADPTATRQHDSPGEEH